MILIICYKQIQYYYSCEWKLLEMSRILFIIIFVDKLRDELGNFTYLKVTADCNLQNQLRMRGMVYLLLFIISTHAMKKSLICVNYKQLLHPTFLFHFTFILLC